VTFDWSAGTETVMAWRLYVGTSPGGSDLFRGSVLPATTLSTSVTGLPIDGSQVHVRLHYRINGVVNSTDYIYTASSQ
jgi:hypothetical protein